jgi:hypothetical protein
MMRQLFRFAIRAFHKSLQFQRIMCTPPAPTSRRNPVFWYSTHLNILLL